MYEKYENKQNIVVELKPVSLPVCARILNQVSPARQDGPTHASFPSLAVSCTCIPNTHTVHNKSLHVWPSGGAAPPHPQSLGHLQLPPRWPAPELALSIRSAPAPPPPPSFQSCAALPLTASLCGWGQNYTSAKQHTKTIWPYGWIINQLWVCVFIR